MTKAEILTQCIERIKSRNPQEWEQLNAHIEGQITDYLAGLERSRCPNTDLIIKGNLEAYRAIEKLIKI